MVRKNHLKKNSENNVKSTYKTTIILCIFSVVLFSCCEKNKDKDFLLLNEWKVKSVTIGNKTLKPPSKTLREEAYILKFSDSSCFLLATSVNFAGGIYNIISDGKITINNYHSFTEVCCENEFDELLLSSLIDVDSYYCKGNKLFFLSGKNNIVFDKK